MIADAISVIAPGSSSSGVSLPQEESSFEGATFAGLVSEDGVRAQTESIETSLKTSFASPATPFTAEDVVPPLTKENLLLADLPTTDALTGTPDKNFLVVSGTSKSELTSGLITSANPLSVDALSSGGRRSSTLGHQTIISGSISSAIRTADSLGQNFGLTTVNPAVASPISATQLATATTEQAAALASTPLSNAATASTVTGETGRTNLNDTADAILKTEDGVIRTETAKALQPARSLTPAYGAHSHALGREGLTSLGQPLNGTVTTDGTTALFGDARSLTSEGSVFFQRVQATTTTAAPVRVEAFQQIADTIRLQTSDQKMMLRLDPPDLGRVGIELSFDNARLVTAVLTAENADTASLLRRSIDNLHRELSSAGFEDVNIDFAEDQSPDAQADLDMWSEDRQLVSMSPAQQLIAARGQMNIISADRIDARF